MNDIYDDDGFDPDQLKALEKLMDDIIAEDGLGFEMVFWISNKEAKNLVELYNSYAAGEEIKDPRPFIDQCMIIASCLKEVIENEKND